MQKMSEKEAIVFLSNAVIESKRILEELKNIKTKAEIVGKVGEYYANFENCEKEIESCRVAIKALEEIQQYRAIGTLDECREAVERMKPKKPNKIHSEITDFIVHYYCPQCGRRFGERGIHNVISFNKEKFCQGDGCGQAIDWSE